MKVYKFLVFSFFLCTFAKPVADYSSLIAPVGQTPAQVPQLTQEPASITNWLSPWLIALLDILVRKFHS